MDALQIIGVVATLLVAGAAVWLYRRRRTPATDGPRRVIALIFFALTSIYGIGVIASHAPEPFNWDEVDYVNASKLGIGANALESGSLNLLDFYRIGKLKGSGNIAAVQQEGRTLPPEATDPFALRHFHPPLATYFWDLWDKVGSSETHWHLSMVFVLGLGMVAVALVTPTQLLFGLSAAAVAFAAPAVIFGYQLLSFHEWHTPALVAFTALLFMADRAPSNRLEIALGIASALLLLTLEMGAIVLGLAILAVIVSGRWRHFLRLAVLARVVGSCIATLVVLWLGFFLKGGTFKAMAMYAYRLVVKQGEEYQTVTPLAFWGHLVTHSPVLILWCAFGVALTIYGLASRRLSRSYAVPLVIGGGYAIFMTPFALRDAYMAPALVALAANTAIAMAGLVKGRERLALALPPIALGAAGLSLLLAFATTPFAPQLERSRAAAKAMDADRLALRQTLATDRPILAVGEQMLRYNAPGYTVDGARAYGSPAQLQERVDYADVPANPDLARGRYGAVVLWRVSPVPPEVAANLVASGYRLVQLNYFTVFLPPSEGSSH